MIPNRFLFILAAVLFLVALVLVVIGVHDAKVIEGLTLGGLASLAGGHAT